MCSRCHLLLLVAAGNINTLVLCPSHLQTRHGIQTTHSNGNTLSVHFCSGSQSLISVISESPLLCVSIFLCSNDACFLCLAVCVLICALYPPTVVTPNECACVPAATRCHSWQWEPQHTCYVSISHSQTGHGIQTTHSNGRYYLDENSWDI